MTFNNDVYQNASWFDRQYARLSWELPIPLQGFINYLCADYQKLLGEEAVNAYFLEFDTDRAGGFEPLAEVTPGKGVVLGLLTSKSGQLENKDEVIARIKEASQYVPLENLYLSTQCGFASTEEGNI